MTELPKVLFFTDNGRGLGHLTRLLAVATRAGGRFQPVFLTMSLGYQLLRQIGVPSEFFPAYHQVGLSKNEWMPLLTQRLVEAIEETEARVVVVDHVIPPAAFQELRSRSSGVRLVWSRRGLWREGKNEAVLEMSGAFDLVVEPGDIAAPIDVGITSTRRDGVIPIGPVVLVQPEEYLPREQARIELGLPIEGRTILLNLSDASSDTLSTHIEHAKKTIQAAAGNEDLHFFAPLHPLHGDRLAPVEGVNMAPVYPVARFFNAFDGAVSTAGYNSFHEIVVSGLPAIFVAHTSTNVDDQERRARFAELSGRGFWAPSIFSTEFEHGVRRLVQEDEPITAAAVTRELGAMTGATEFADLLVGTIDEARSQTFDVDAGLTIDPRIKIRPSSGQKDGDRSHSVVVYNVSHHNSEQLSRLAGEIAGIQRNRAISPLFLVGEASPQPLLDRGFPFESTMSEQEWLQIHEGTSYEQYLSMRLEQLKSVYGPDEIREPRPEDASDVPARTFGLTLPSERRRPPRVLDISLPARFYVPALLEERGLAGYEAASLACWMAILTQPDEGAAFDVGANVGPYAWLAAALTNRPTVAFEPEPTLLAGLAKVAESNGLRIRGEAIALTDHEGSATLYLSDHTDSSHSLVSGFRRSSKSIEVPVRTLDSYVSESGLVPHAVKIDTETNEPAVLRGGMATFSRHRPWLIVEVLAQRTEVELTEAMAPLGYSWYEIDDSLPLVRRDEIVGDPEHVHMNWLFAPAEPGDGFWAAMSQWKQAMAGCLPLCQSPRNG